MYVPMSYLIQKEQEAKTPPRNIEILPKEVMEEAIKRPSEPGSHYHNYQRRNSCPVCGYGGFCEPYTYLKVDGVTLWVCGNGHAYPYSPYEVLC